MEKETGGSGGASDVTFAEFAAARAVLLIVQRDAHRDAMKSCIVVTFCLLFVVVSSVLPATPMFPEHAALTVMATAFVALTFAVRHLEHALTRKNRADAALNR